MGGLGGVCVRTTRIASVGQGAGGVRPMQHGNFNEDAFKESMGDLLGDDADVSDTVEALVSLAVEIGNVLWLEESGNDVTPDGIHNRILTKAATLIEAVANDLPSHHS